MLQSVFLLSTASSHFVLDDSFPLECKEILDDLANSSSALTACMLEKSLPWFMSCRKCVHHFQQMQSVYSRLERSDLDKNVSCRDVFFYGAKINLVEEVYEDALRVWQLPDCAACFQEKTDVNGEWKLKNITGEFFRRFAEYANCREGHFPNATDLCRECRPPYEKTKRFFSTHFELSQKSICMDVSDTWNKTQREWSVRFHCHVSARDLFLLGTFTSFVLVLPVIFYLSIYLNSETQRQSFARMKRASESAVLSDVEFDTDAIDNWHR